MITGKGENATTSDAVASRSRGQHPKVVGKKDRSTERKGKRLNDRGDRSRSKSRTFSPKQHLNTKCEVPN